jgi:hypothetical protein
MHLSVNSSPTTLHHLHSILTWYVQQHACSQRNTVVCAESGQIRLRISPESGHNLARIWPDSGQVVACVLILCTRVVARPISLQSVANHVQRQDSLNMPRLIRVGQMNIPRTTHMIRYVAHAQRALKVNRMSVYIVQHPDMLLYAYACAWQSGLGNQLINGRWQSNADVNFIDLLIKHLQIVCAQDKSGTDGEQAPRPMRTRARAVWLCVMRHAYV